MFLPRRNFDEQRLGRLTAAKVLFLLFLAVTAIEKASAIPLSSFYSYGPGAGDNVLAANDDGSTDFTLSQDFVFFEENFRLIYVNNNGDITFNSALPSYTSQPFPLAGVPIIAPFWADVDTRCGGGPVYYRETTDSSIRSKAVNEIPYASSNGFNPTHVTIVTWPYVGYYSCHTDKTNTFQAVLITDGTSSYVMFNYLDDGIQWTTGDASGGSNGFGGTPAQVGFNKGDSENYFSASLSRTSDVVNIETTSNIGVAGRYVWQVNGEIITPAPQCPILTVSNTAGGLMVSNPSPATSGTTATYSCTTGYTLVGNTQRTCQSSLSWSGSEPYCSAVDCGSLSACCGLGVSLTGTTYNSVATYSCTNIGYQLIGSSTRTCSSGGSWSGSEPYCQIVSCGGLSASGFLSVSTTGTTYGSTASYSCAYGYQLVGSSSRTCQANGIWSGSAPYCNIVSCGSLTTSGTGGLSGSLTGTTYGSTATYSCTQTGYELVGTATLTCLGDGAWSGSVPYCTLVDCGGLSISGTGGPVVSYPATTYSSTATYSCSMTGYELIGSSTRVCQSNGVWSGSAPYCQIVSCGSLSISGAGGITVSTTGIVYNSVATYTCTQVGYELIGGSQRTCQANGVWSGSDPYCQLVDCGPLSISGTGGISVSTTGTTYSEVASYTCTVIGYELVGISQRVCQANAIWSESAPYCQLIDCGIPDLPSDTTALNVFYTTTTYASIVTYHCDIGYNFFGTTSRTCLETYMWSGSPPHCEIVDCGALTTDSNALGSLAVSFTTTVYLSTAVYTCPDVGYVLIGADTLICRETGSWVANPPHCDIVPLNFAGNVISATEIQLSWDLPPNPSDVEDLVEHYTVTVTTIETGQEVSFLTFTKETTLQFLHPYYNYVCSVAVVTDHINPDSSSLSFLTLPAAPSSAPLNPSHQIINSRSFSISWYAPLIEDQNGIIQNYVIQLIEVDTGVVSQFSPTSTSITLNGLHPYYTYLYSISAFTVGEGPYTLNNSVTMPEDAPTAAPTNLSGSAVDSRTIILTWSPPPLEEQNGDIRKYNISIFEVETETTFTSVSQTLTATIESLHPNYNYQCIIAAVTIASGPYTETFNVTTPEDTPSTAPSNFNAVATSPYNATLTWDPLPVADQNGVITGYIINVTIIETAEKLQLISTTTSLTVTTLRPFRTYICIVTAQTAIGIGPFSGEFTLLTPQDVPSAPPVSVTSPTITSRSFVLSWSPPDYYHQNGIIIGYEVLITEAETSTVLTYNASPSTSLSVQPVHPAYTYQCVVAAVTVVGTGPYTTAFSVTANEDVPTGTPQQLDAVDVLSRSITFSWDPPLFEEQNGVIISYKLNITALATSSVQSYTTVSTTFTVTNLVPFSYYTYVIAAATAIGQGPYTETTTIITPEDAPNTAPSVTTAYAADSRTVALQWSPPPPQDHNGIIREYRVNVTSLDSGDHVQVVALDTTTIIGSLIPSFTYIFTVTAFTVAEGPYSQVYSITMPPDVPTGFPQDIVAVSNSYDSITLSWNPPLLEEQNGDIIQYVVNITHTITLERVQYTLSATSITIMDLDPYTNYVCVVAAATVTGLGPFSTLVHVRTLEAVPGSHPQNPNAVSLTSTSILITWDAPNNPNGEIDGYHIYVTEAETGQIIMQESSVTQITIYNLHPFYTYNCLIVAFTVGDGPNVTVSVVTQEDAPSSPPQAVATSVIDSTSISVSWNPPPQANQNGIIREYSLFVENVATGEILSFSTQSTNMIVSGLRPYTSYNCKVAAITVATGPFSTSTTVTTSQDVPSGPPLMFNATSLSSDELLLNWLPPSPDVTNGVIQNYILVVTEIETITTSQYITSVTDHLLSDLHPYYTYVCNVSAVTIGAGPETTIIVQMPEDLPTAAPGNIAVVSITSSSISFSWDPLPVEQQNGIIRHYSIAVAEEDTGMLLQKESTTESITLNNLHPFYTYSVQVSASTVDDGPPSLPISVTTLENVPSSAPTNFYIDVVSPISIELSWQPPAASDQNGVITGYSISVLKPSSGEVIIDQTISGTNFSITGLLPHTTYVCSVLASTSVGMGPSTSLTILTPQDVPSTAPVGLSGAVVSSTSLLLSWLAPQADTHNGIIVLYTVFVLETDTGMKSYHNTTETSLALTSLHPYYEYNCSVAAVTVGYGPHSAILSLRTSQDAPSAPPSALVVMATDPRSINITWNPPPADALNGIVMYYVVNVTVQNANMRSHYTASGTELILSNLHPYYTYSVVVAAFTVAKSPFSAKVSVTTPQDAPSSPPRNLQSGLVTFDSIELSWQPPLVNDLNGLIQSYTLIILEIDTNTTKEEHQNFTQNSVSLSSLHPYYSYQISVAAYTVALGPFATITVQTEQNAPSSGPKDLSFSFSSSSSVTLQWNSPDSDEVNGVILHYSIKVFNNETLSTTDYTSQVTSLNLNNLHPYYNYECSIAAVTVALGVATNIAFQMPEDVPTSSPDMVRTTILTSNKVQLVWNEIPAAEQNGLITYYTVIVYNTRSQLETSYTTSSASLTLSSLSPFTTYRCKVAANTSVGMGPYTTELVFETEEDIPSSPPENVEAISVSSSAVTVSWSPPSADSQNGVIRKYIVNILEMETAVITALNTTETSIALISLHPYYLYHCFVAAVTVGIGPFSNVSIWTQQDAPTSSPVGVANGSVSSSSIPLFWNPPPDDQINGVIQYYIVKVQVSESQEQLQHQTSSLQLTLTDLQPYCTHTIQVAAFTVALGPFSEPLTIVTLEDAPSGPPQNPVSDLVTSTTVEFSWEPPLPDTQNGVIDSYTVLVVEVTTMLTVQIHQNVTSTSITLTDLHPAYKYTLSVAAFTVDLGPAASVAIVTKEAPPSQGPRNLEVRPTSSSTIDIQWNSPDIDQSNGVIRYYSIELFNIERGDTRTFTTPETSFTITSLHPYYKYNISVTAVTVSEGVKSSFAIQMPEDAPTGAPQNVNVTAINSSVLQITWNAPAFESQNGLIRSYYLNIKEIETELQLLITVADELQATVSGLHGRYNYQVKIAARTIELGPFSAPMTRQLPEGTPSTSPSGVAAELIGLDTVMILWNHLPEEQQNGDILGYSVSCTSQEGHNLLQAVNGTSVKFMGLATDSHYTCTVCAYTAVGCGPAAVTYISTFEGSQVGPAVSLNTTVTATTIHLEWEAPYDPQSLITSYFILYQLVNTSAPVLVPRNPEIAFTIGSTSVTMENLLQDSVYTIQVFPQTDMGNGKGSEVLTVLTLTPASEAPSNFQCSATSSTTFVCSWEPPSAPNYILLDYDLAYRLADGFDFYSSYGDKVEINGLQSEAQLYMLSGLQPYTGYIIQLTSNLILNLGSGDNDTLTSSLTLELGSGDNVPEDGDESDEMIWQKTSVLTFTWEEEPIHSVEELNLKVKSPTRVELTWVPPARMSWRGVIQYYLLSITRLSPINNDGRANTNDHTYTEESTVQVAPASNHPDPSLASDPLMTELFVKDNLEENFQYSFTVAVANSAGIGPSSAALIRNMPEAVPSGAPTNISVTNSSDSFITISWLPPNPLEANGIITGYALRFYRVDIGDELHFELSAEQRSFTKTGLRPYENITVQLAASTVLGQGPFSDEIVVNSKEAVSSEPRELTARIPRGTNNILLTWLTPSNPNGELIGYLIVYKGITRDEGIVRVGPINVTVRASEELEYVLTNAVSDLIYDFNVSAVNGAGYGKNSSAIVYTPSSPVTGSGLDDTPASVNVILIILCVVLSLAGLSLCVLLTLLTIIAVLRQRRKKKYMLLQGTEALFRQGITNPVSLMLNNTITHDDIIVENELYEKSFLKEKARLSFQEDSDDEGRVMKNIGADEDEAKTEDDGTSPLGDGWL